MKILRKF